MNNSTNTMLGILAGTAIGAVLGILFAPDKGVNTRRKIAEQAISTKDTIVEGATELKDRVVNVVVAKKESFEERIESAISDASYKVEDVIKALEKKLRELKAENKKLQQS